ncbi:hypothetical protein C8F04DRAFT_1362343 [Mycena alexandri]|uniref:Uncharacterized protein n=1 Tax=Mycena alexandri TaxID=1745969 RepID=A0AAD6XBS0_9AGAR|nr:hypothetical protein C8F04DRAFT_1362343 [Mycena alexandri]
MPTQKLRQLGGLERYLATHHFLGLETCIVTSARYTNPENTLLTEAVLFPAIKALIETHAPLGIRLEGRPDSVDVAFARLRTIDLPRVVEFSETRDLQKALEKQLGRPFEDTQTNLPLWRVEVLPNNTILYCLDQVFSLRVRSGISPPSPNYVRAAGSHRRLSSAHARWDLSAILSFAHAQWDLTANFPLLYACAVGSYCHPSITCARLDPTAILLFAGAQWDFAANFPLYTRGGIPPPSSRLRVRSGIVPPSFCLRVCSGISPPPSPTRARLDPTAILLFVSAQWDLAAKFPLCARGGIPPPSSRLRVHSGISPPNFLCAPAVGSHRHPLVCGCTVGSRRQISSARLRWDLTAILSFVGAQWDLAAKFPLRACGGISPPPLADAYAAGSHTN